MHILLDESLPRKLGFLLAGHHVRTVQQLGLSGLVNGKKLLIPVKDIWLHSLRKNFATILCK